MDEFYHLYLLQHTSQRHLCRSQSLGHILMTSNIGPTCWPPCSYLIAHWPPTLCSILTLTLTCLKPFIPIWIWSLTKYIVRDYYNIWCQVKLKKVNLFRKWTKFNTGQSHRKTRRLVPRFASLCLPDTDQWKWFSLTQLTTLLCSIAFPNILLKQWDIKFAICIKLFLLAWAPGGRERGGCRRANPMANVWGLHIAESKLNESWNIYQSINYSINQSINRSINQSINQLINQSIN